MEVLCAVYNDCTIVTRLGVCNRCKNLCLSIKLSLPLRNPETQGYNWNLDHSQTIFFSALKYVCHTCIKVPFYTTNFESYIEFKCTCILLDLTNKKQTTDSVVFL